MAQGNTYPAPSLPLTGAEQFTIYQQNGAVVGTFTATLSQISEVLPTLSFENPPPIGLITPNTGNFTSLTGSFNGTVGATTPNSGKFTTINASGSITNTSQVSTSANGPLYLSNYVFGTSAGYNANVIQGNDQATGGYLNRLSVTQACSNGFSGNRTAIVGSVIVAAPGSLSGGSAYVAINGAASASANALGTATSPAAGLWGGVSSAILYNGATNYAEVFGQEIDVAIRSGASGARKNGLNIVLLTGDANRGFQEDAAISFNAQSGVSTSWAYGIEFGSPSQSWAFGTDSTLIGAVQRVYGTAEPFTYNTANIGIDFRYCYFTSAAFVSPGFSVDALGDINCGNIKIAGGLQCATETVSSVSVINGGIFTAYPTFTIITPVLWSGGTQATATVTAMAATGGAISLGNAGTGYVTGDVVTLSGGTGTKPTYTVTASGGVVTALTPASAGSMTALPTMPASFTGGTGTGLTATVGFAISTMATTPGSGYVTGAAPALYLNTVPIQAPVLQLNMNGTVTGQTLTLNDFQGGQYADVRIGDQSAIPTNATKGFLKIPHCAGTPTGTPADTSGPSVVYNTTSHTLNIYDEVAAAWYHVTLSSGAA